MVKKLRKNVFYLIIYPGDKFIFLTLSLLFLSLLSFPLFFSPVPSLYILFTTMSTIRRVSLDLSTKYDVVLVEKQQSVDLVDYYLRTGLIVWTDNSSNSIMASDMNGDGVRVLKTGLRSIGGMAVDWITGNVYYTDPFANRIGVVSSNNYDIILSINTVLTQPTSIAVDPRQGSVKKILKHVYLGGGRMTTCTCT